MLKHAAVIERVERIRHEVGMNKSQFSTSIGMKPQTYNNFVGKQQSKPSVELLIGVTSKFSVNPSWLLNGSGSVFLDQAAQFPREAPRTGPSADGEESLSDRAHPQQRASSGSELDRIADEFHFFEHNIMLLSDHLRRFANICTRLSRSTDTLASMLNSRVISETDDHD